jgi:hypothetical protein
MKQILLMIAVVGLMGGCGATTTQFVPLPTGEISAPNNGMSRIIISRFPGFIGGGVGYRIILNGKPIGELGPRGFLYWDTEPGFKTLEVRAEPFGESYSGWKQFHAKSNDLTVLKIQYYAYDWERTGNGNTTQNSNRGPYVLWGSKEKLLSELKRRKK